MEFTLAIEVHGYAGICFKLNIYVEQINVNEIDYFSYNQQKWGRDFISCTVDSWIPWKQASALC